ncbi:hypothetical protein BTO04_00995 [Polaribacter sp. SA4-10]|uniref:BspA family leucine-rich repeat surface protein n=1 Tax=Polaribacter sp. SA4-10 TaxID=754397 RepID=UPI000B3BF971|nr:BspA family leucine-rich repeat surface protein [Polaribacter sp. SA4-10]ARV05352.1 hypothetical protein BTO04_00995 [Polaribacter sp. SA4-10]
MLKKILLSCLLLITAINTQSQIWSKYTEIIGFEVNKKFGSLVATDGDFTIISDGEEKAYIFSENGISYYNPFRNKINSNYGSSLGLDGGIIRVPPGPDLHKPENIIKVAVSGDNYLVATRSAIRMYEKGASTTYNTLAPPNGSSFNGPIAIDGSNVIAGAANGTYIYTKNGGGYNSPIHLNIQEQNSFATSVDIHGNFAIVGGSSGFAYIFEKIGGLWIQTEKLFIHSPVAGAFYNPNSPSISVSIHGSNAVVSSNEGILVFNNSNGSWSQTAKLIIDAPSIFFGFGNRFSNIAINKATITIGVASYLYIFNNYGNNTWIETKKVRLPSSSSSSGIGLSGGGIISLALSDNKVILGSNVQNSAYDIGAAYILPYDDSYINNSNFSLASNGQTCLCENAVDGESGTLIIDGIAKNFTKRNLRQLTDLQNRDTDYNRYSLGETPETSLTCTSGITDLRGIFASGPYTEHRYQPDEAQSYLGHWDVSNVTNMMSMFSTIGVSKGRITEVDQGFEYWDTSNVTNMRFMFANTQFGIRLAGFSNWDTSNVTDMNGMFMNSRAIGLDLSNWNTSNVKDMSGMFSYAAAYINISNWDTSNVTNMSQMFVYSGVHGDISNWDVSKVTNMSEMFRRAESFNQDISNWDVSKVTNMTKMFSVATSFKYDISNWCVSKIPYEPTEFANGTYQFPANFRPVWGTCPSECNVEALVKDITINLDNNGNAILNASDIDNGSSATCGIATISTDKSTFNCSNLGVNIVNLTATDVNGNQSITTANVTVEDKIAPTVITKDITVQLDANGNAFITPDMINDGSNDACGIASLEFLSAATGGELIINGGFDNATNDWTRVGGYIEYRTTGGNPGAYVVLNDVGGSSDPGLNQVINGLTIGQTYIIIGDYRNAYNCCGAFIGQTAFGVDVDGNQIAALPNPGTNWSPFSVTFTATSSTHTVGFRGEINGTDTDIAIDNVSIVAPTGNTTTTLINYSCADVIANEVTLVVTDVNGNISNKTALVTVIDKISPEITAPANISVFATSAAGAVVDYITPVGTDNCAATTILTEGLADGATFPIGVTTVTYTATDASGNRAVASFNVEVVGIAPEILVPTNISVSNDSGICGAVINYTATETTGIPASTITYDIQPGSLFTIGSVTVTATATNAIGTSTKTFTVNVNDNEAPTAIAKDISIDLDANGFASITPSMIDNASFDACGIESILFAGSGTFNATTNEGNNLVLQAPLGSVIDGITFASYGTPNNNNAGTFTIGSCHASNSLSIVESYALGKNSVTIPAVNGLFGDPCGGTYKRLYVTATYSAETTTAGFTCANVGNNQVTLLVTDINGNIATATANVTVKDNIAPNVITQNITVELDANGVASITTSMIDDGSNDACGIKSYTLDIDNFTCANVGANNVILSVEDNNGNVASLNATVTVQDNIAPNVITQNITVELDANGVASITPLMINNGSSDACGIKSYTLDIDNFTCANVGANNVILSVEDNNGNVASLNAAVTVQDNIAPNVITQNITIELDANGVASITTSMIDDGSADACGIKSYTLDIDNFTCANVGANTVILTVTDNNNNISTQTATVTVKDNVDPIAITQSATVQLDASGNGMITADDIDNGSNDACGIKSLELDTTSFSCENVGLNTVTLTVTDNNDNVSTQTATVTVEDTTAPIVITQSYSIDLTNGVADITPSDIDGGTFDNCDFTLSIDKDHFTCDDIGDHVVTLTATDASNNTTSSTAIVSVLGDVPTIAINDFNAVDTQKENTIFLGFADTVNLTTTVSGGSGFTYEWTTSSGEIVSNEANPSISPEVSTTYNVTVTNSNGCNASTSIYVCVIDARAFDKKGKYKGKVTVCHHTNGKKGTNHVQINISSDGVMTHLTKHGVGTDYADTLGACNAVCVDNTNARSASKTSFTTTSIEDNLLIYPNPSNGIFDIKLTSVNLQTELFLFDTTGKLIERTSISKENSAENIITIGNHNLASGIYLLKIINKEETITKKLIIEKSN